MFKPPVLTEEEKIAKHYESMGHSVTLINNFRAGNHPDDMEAEQVNHVIDQNVEHLKIMVAKDYWTDEDMTEVNAAIEWTDEDMTEVNAAIEG